MALTAIARAVYLPCHPRIRPSVKQLTLAEKNPYVTASDRSLQANDRLAASMPCRGGSCSYTSADLPPPLLDNRSDAYGERRSARPPRRSREACRRAARSVAARRPFGP